MSSNRAHGAWWIAIAAVSAVLLLPLLVVDVPPLGDYPNHLARAFVLASWPDDPVLAKMFQPHWTLLPNLGSDLLVTPLIRVLPVHLAGRIVVGLAVLTPVLGAVAYGAALGNRWWSLCAALAAWNGCLLYGFLNFSLALGPPLLIAAAWLRWRAARPATVIGLAAAGATGVFFLHLMGLVFLAALLGGAEVVRLLGQGPRRGAGLQSWRSALGGPTGLGLVFVLPLVLYTRSALQQLGGDAAWLTPVGKLRQLGTAFVNYDAGLDVLTAVAAAGVPLLGLAYGRGRMPLAAAVPALGLTLAYVAAPYAWKGTYLLDTRFAVMLGLLVFAGFVPRNWPRGLTAAVACGMAGLLAARMAVLTAAFHGHAADLAAVRSVIAPVRPGEAVLTATVTRLDAESYWARDPHRLTLSDGTRTDAHLGALLLMERRAYWPFEFDVPSQQPIETTPAYAVLAAKADAATGPRSALLAADLCGFDNVLQLEADALPPLPADRFTVLAKSGFGVLYRIDVCRPNPSLAAPASIGQKSGSDTRSATE